MDSDRKMWVVGSSVFVLYLGVLATAFIVPAVTNWKYFKWIIRTLHPALTYLSLVLLLLGFCGFILGVVTTSAVDWKQQLFPLIGSMVFLEGLFLYQYLNAMPEKIQRYLKLLSINSAFLIAMFAIATGVGI